MKNKEILIEDAIKFHEEQVKVCSEKMTRALFGEERCEELKAEHIQRAKWLRELQEYKTQPEIIHCCECKFFRANMSPDGYIPKGAFEFECKHWNGSCDPTDFCSYGERKPDGSI